MGLRFRKSVNFDPLRFNFNKSGIGYSVGCPGYRVTQKYNGQMYTTASIPGIGLSYVENLEKKEKPVKKYSKTTIVLTVMKCLFIYPIKFCFWVCFLSLIPLSWLVKLMCKGVK